jgi:ABC-2 type transport system permease protein
MRKAFSIAGINLRRVFRDRVSLFFMLVFPFAIILTIGAVFGASFTPVLGVVSEGSGPLGADLLSRLESADGIRVRTFDDRDALTTAVERGQVEAGLVIPPGYDQQIHAGDTVQLPYIRRPAGAGQEGQLVVAAVVDQQAVVLRAARFASTEGVGTFDQALAQAEAIAPDVPMVTVRTTVAGGSEVSAFGYGAAQELILFVFVISLAASGMLIESRRIGVSRRMLASPTSARTVILGETLGRFGIALFQGFLIMAVTLALFRVDWGDPVAAGSIVVLFALTGTGAAMLMGSVLNNAQQAGSFGVFFGLVLAALGGCMVPLEVFPPLMVKIAHMTPQAWAIDAFGKVLGKAAGVGQILPELGVLALYAAVLLGLATVLFRRKLTA